MSCGTGRECTLVNGRPINPMFWRRYTNRGLSIRSYKKRTSAKNPMPTVKTLRTTWLPEEDVFTFKANPLEENFQLTKRYSLKRIATLFDAVGKLAPFTTDVPQVDRINKTE